MPVTGLVATHAVATHAVDDLIPDSAAAGTALSTGGKTINGSVGVDVSGQSYTTILEAARDAGLSTSLITTTSLADATPAVFASHVRTRSMKEEIALQMLRARVNVLFGIDFALHEGCTLVLVTADHETGGSHIIKGAQASRKFEYEMQRRE